jgi:NADH-quinone oxidoreductase subunit N
VIALRPLLLPLLVAGAAALVLVADAVWPRLGRAVGWLTAALLGAILVVSTVVDVSGVAARGAYLGTAWSLFFARLFLVAGILAVLGSIEHVEKQVARRQGEYYLLLLLSITGMLLLPGARDLLLLVVAFELMGLPLYILSGYAKTDAPAVQGPGRSPAAEAALKLYLVGAASTAITLFGLSLVVGMAGTTRLDGLAVTAPIAQVGMLLVLAGLSFKIGVVPFHMWIPDTYQGAPMPFVAFLSVAPKAAGVAALTAVFVLGAHDGPWWAAMAVLAGATMLAGNLLALPQTDVRRLLGFSGVGQMGYVLLAVAARSSAGLGMAAFYLAGYVFSNIGAFLVLHAVAEDAGRHDFVGLAGLHRRSPWLAMALLLFLLSLAGIPFVVGFWAKLYVFLAAYRAGLIVLVAIGAVLTVVGLFYYMHVARAAFMTEPTVERAPRVGGPLRAAIIVCLVAVVGLGLWPGPMFESAAAAGASLVQTK